MDDELEVELQDLATDEIRELLAESGAELSPEQAEQLVQFVSQAGSIEAGLLLLSQLAQEHRAA
jgi:hypothetical protein